MTQERGEERGEKNIEEERRKKRGERRAKKGEPREKNMQLREERIQSCLTRAHQHATCRTRRFLGFSVSTDGCAWARAVTTIELALSELCVGATTNHSAHRPPPPEGNTNQRGAEAPQN